MEISATALDSLVLSPVEPSKRASKEVDAIDSSNGLPKFSGTEEKRKKEERFKIAEREHIEAVRKQLERASQNRDTEKLGKSSGTETTGTFPIDQASHDFPKEAAFTAGVVSTTQSEEIKSSDIESQQKLAQAEGLRKSEPENAQEEIQRKKAEKEAARKEKQREEIRKETFEELQQKLSGVFNRKAAALLIGKQANFKA